MEFFGESIHTRVDWQRKEISARDGQGHTVCAPFPYSMENLYAHWKIAERLCRLMGWRGYLWAAKERGGFVFAWEGEGNLFKAEG